MKRHLSFVAALGMCFSALTATAYAQQVKADTGGVAIGGSVTGSTINIGIPQAKVDELVRDAKRPLEELTALQRDSIALLKEKLDLNLGQVRAALNIVGENNIPPEQLAAKLVEIAERFKDLQATASAQPGDSPAIISLKTEAQRAIEAGELAKADALLADVETEQRQHLDRLAAMQPRHQPDAATSPSPDCVTPRPPSILPTRLRFSLRTAPTRTSGSDTCKERQTHYIGKEPNLATTVL